jgi:hypothetical protein
MKKQSKHGIGEQTMANEKRLIDANWILGEIEHDLGCYEIGKLAKDESLYVELKDIVRMVCDAPTVDAVEVNKYEALVVMYNDLRENFVDYVCSGIRNEAPYCLNKCEECVDKRGWCKLEKCQGFNPAEVILDRYAKMDGDGN